MLKIYGSKMCEDTRVCIEMLKKENIEFELKDITESLDNLKEFLAIRDSSPLYEEVKAAGSIGIPYIQKENKEGTLDWESIPGGARLEELRQK